MRALKAVGELNEKYAAGGAPIFYMCIAAGSSTAHRGRWTGKEKGAIIEFNRLLRGACDTSFDTISGDMSVLPEYSM